LFFRADLPPSFRVLLLASDLCSSGFYLRPIFMPSSRTFEIGDLAETEAFGRRLGEQLFPGAVVALLGRLGAGKTHLTRAIAEGLGVRNPAAVNSPTFVLIQEYPARLPVYHFDAYRLSGAREFAELGVEEYFGGDGVCVIEWADKVEAALPREHLRIEIEVVDENRRRFTMTGVGERNESIVRDL
jgi:tRNA threonylcarbamoyladenosine biosynthesis protein TsaE